MRIMLSGVRLAFPAVFKAQQVNGEGDPAFSACFIMDPKKQAALLKSIEKAFKDVAKDKWGAKADANLKGIEAKDKTCLHDGDGKPEYDGFEGMLYMSARNKQRPLVLDAGKSPLTEEDGKPYAGCYVNASVEIWAMDNNYGKRICASLKGIQFVADGEAFGGGGVASPDEFEELEATEEGVDDMFS